MSPRPRATTTCVEKATSLGYQGMTINVGNGPRAENPLGANLVRQALSLSIDRNAINQVVFEGAFAPGNQPFSPTSPWYNADFPVPERDVDAAKALLAEAGYADGITIEVQVANNPVQTQVMQVVQAMAARPASPSNWPPRNSPRCSPTSPPVTTGQPDRLVRPGRSRWQHPPVHDHRGRHQRLGLLQPRHGPS
jgi:hypothetical protein